MPFRCNCKPLRIAPPSSIPARVDTRRAHQHTHTHTWRGGRGGKERVEYHFTVASADSEMEGEKGRAGSHLHTHLADNQIRAGVQYITDKLFIKQKAWIAAELREIRGVWARALHSRLLRGHVRKTGFHVAFTNAPFMSLSATVAQHTTTRTTSMSGAWHCRCRCLIPNGGHPRSNGTAKHFG